MGIWRDAEGTLAFDLQCPHLGADLSEGRVEDDDTLHCPWHGYVFSIRRARLIRSPNIEAMRREPTSTWVTF